MPKEKKICGITGSCLRTCSSLIPCSLSIFVANGEMVFGSNINLLYSLLCSYLLTCNSAWYLIWHGPVQMQTKIKYTVRFPESLYGPLIRDSEEASVQIFRLDESHWDYSDNTISRLNTGISAIQYIVPHSGSKDRIVIKSLQKKFSYVINHCALCLSLSLSLSQK